MTSKTGCLTISRSGRAVVQGAHVRRYVDRMLGEDVERHDLQGPLVARGQDHGSGRAVVVGLQPADGDDAPTVAGHEPGKAPLGPRGDEVVAHAALVLEEPGRHHGAHRVKAQVLGAAPAVTVAVVAGERLGAARLERLTEDV